MLIVDAHQDIAYNVLALGRDFTTSVQMIRQREGAARPGIGTCALALPELLAGGVALVAGTLFTLPASVARHTSLPPHYSYTTPEEAHQQACRQLDVYRTLAQRDDVSLVTQRSQVSQLLAQHEAGSATEVHRSDRLGVVILMENADPIRTPDEVWWWQQQGVRIIGPAWRATRSCGGTGAPGALTAEGRALLDAMARAGLVLDVSHMAEESFWEALQRFDGTIIASHSNCRIYVDAAQADRHLSDAMLRALIARDGVVGMVLYNTFLVPRAAPGTPHEKAAVTLDAVVRHIDHICQLAGNAQHVAIGSDVDGGFGSEGMPRELESVADFPRIAERLREVGFSERDTAAVMGGNWLRVLQRGLPA